jgi:uncharacterized protein Smg (DUF494 family)
VDERLSTLLASLHERFDPAADGEREVRAFLVAEGYEERRIGEILELFYGDDSPFAESRKSAAGGSSRPPTIRQAAAFRVLGPHERGRFAPEAWGYLLGLSGSGVLNPAELEQVIDRALGHIDGRIGLDDLRALIEGSGDGEGGVAGRGTTVH